MDFVVSKVAMSICALLVMGAILGALQGQDFVEPVDELRDIAVSFCAVSEGLLRDGGEGGLAWRVPFAASGGSITISLGGESVVLSGSGRHVVERTWFPINTWSWDGTEMNSTQMRDRELHAPRIQANSGEDIWLSCTRVAVDNDWTTALFARTAPRPVPLASEELIIPFSCQLP